MARTIPIAGASRGIGLALAGEFVARGWHVVGTVRDTDMLIAARDRPGLRYLDRFGKDVPW